MRINNYIFQWEGLNYNLSNNSQSINDTIKLIVDKYPYSKSRKLDIINNINILLELLLEIHNEIDIPIKNRVYFKNYSILSYWISNDVPEKARHFLLELTMFFDSIIKEIMYKDYIDHEWFSILLKNKILFDNILCLINKYNKIIYNNYSKEEMKILIRKDYIKFSNNKYKLYSLKWINNFKNKIWKNIN